MRLLSTFLLILGQTVLSNAAFATPMTYTFEGVVSGFRSYHSDYSIADFDVDVGSTKLRYVFVVDLDEGNSSHTNTAGTWNNFYSDLLEGSVIHGGRSYGDYGGFDWMRVSGPNIGQISSNLANVRVTASAADTANWRVSDWMLGQRFESTDLACYRGGLRGCAVYAYGDVELVNIASAAVPEPSSLSLMATGLLLGLAGMFRRRSGANRANLKR